MATMRKIGATIALEGESAFKKSVSACTSSLKTMKSELSLVSTQYADNANSLEALTAKHEALDKTLEQAQRVEQETANALLNSQQNYAKAGDQIEEYKRQLEEAEKALKEMQDAQAESSSSVSDSDIKSQTEEVERLTDMISRGEKEYERAGKNVETWQQKLNSAKAEVINLSRELETNDKYMDEAANSADHCATSIDQYGKKVKEANDKVKSSYQEAADAAKETSDKMSTFFTAEKIEEYADRVSEAFQEVVASTYEAHVAIQEGYDSIAKLTGATGSELEDFKDVASNLYGDLPVEMTEIGSAVGQVNQRFDVTGDSLENLSSKFLKFCDITGADLTENVGLAQRVMDAFGDDASKAGDYLDVLAYTAQTTGAEIGELQENTLEQSAALQEMGADSLAAINFMGQLQSSGIYTEAVMGALEDAYDTCKQEGKDFVSTLLEVQDELLNNENEAEANQKAYDLFGESFAKVAAAIRSGQVDFTALSDSMGVLNRASGTVDKTFDETTHTYDRMTTAINKLKEIGGEMVGEVMDTAAPAVELLADVLGALNDGFQSLPTPVRRGVTAVALVGTTCGVVAPKVISLLENINAFKEAGTIAKQINDLKNTIDNLRTVDKAADAVSDVADSVENLTDVAKTATSGTGAIGNVAEAVSDLSDTAKKADTVGDVADAVGDVADASTAGTTAVSGFMSKLGGVVTKAGPYALAIGGIAAVFATLIKNAAEANEEMTNAIDLADDYIEKSKDINENISQAAEDYKTSIEELNVKDEMTTPLEEALIELQSQTNKTSEDIDVMESIVNELNSVYPDLGLSIDDVTGKLYAQGEEVKNLSDYLDDFKNKAKESAEQNYLQGIYDELTDAKVQQRLNKIQIGELEDQKKNNTIVVEDTSGLIANREHSSPVAALWNDFQADRKIKELKEQNKELAATEEELSEKIEATGEALGYEEEAVERSSSAKENASEIVSGLGDSVDSTAQQYVELATRLQQAGGDIEAVSASFSEEETALQELFNSTVVAWQESHDQITSGLASEVQSLSESAGAWQEYKTSAMDSIQSASSMFAERTTDDSVTWDTMMGNLTANADAYAQWNENVNAILSSARYANDEAFREIANSIMTGGIESSEYLQNFVDNVDLSTTTAVDDIKQFANLGDVSDTYAGTMANLQSATESGMGAIASAYDSTKTAAQQSLTELATSMQEQADLYNDFVEYSNNIIESERYKTDENFRMYANTLMQQGIEGAEQVKSLWEGMESGSQEVDQAVNSYMSLQDAQDKYANTWASIQTATQDGVNGTVTTIGSAGDAWKLAAMNNSDLLAAGIDMDKLERTVTLMSSKANNAIERTFADEETRSEVKSAGYDVGYNYGEGVLNGCNDALNGEIDGAPLATLLRQDVINALGREFED